MSIIDNVGDLRARLEEIEAEKAAGISGPVLILNEVGDVGRLEILTPSPPIPPQEPLAWLSLESRAEMLMAQVRLYTRLRAESMQDLQDTKARIAALKLKE